MENWRKSFFLQFLLLAFTIQLNSESLILSIGNGYSMKQNGHLLKRFNCSIIDDKSSANNPHDHASSLLSIQSDPRPLQDPLIALINLQNDASQLYHCFLITATSSDNYSSFSTSSSSASRSPWKRSVSSIPFSSASLVLSSLLNGHPRFLETFHDTIVEPKSKLSLKCVATGNPLPQITWTLDGGAINENHRVRVGDFVSSDGLVNSFVNITAITVREGGFYTCLATNGGHTIKHSARLTVYGQPYVKPMDNLTVLSGGEIRINCPYSGHPIHSISWFRGSTRLPENRRQSVHPNGTLVINSADRVVDQDSYRCVVSGNGGESASGQVYVRVRIAPLISIDSPSNLREGMRSMLTCNVLEGDPPFIFQWLKDGSQIRGFRRNVNISSINEYSSTLFISELTFADSGNYTCVISNDVAYANHTISILVKVPPKWILTPSDTDAVLGDDVSVDCQASGYPHPRIWWEHAKTQSSAAIPSHYQTVISNSHIHALENGSLIIKDAAKTDEGLYLCQATNSIGSDISKLIRLSVHVPAYFEQSFMAKTVKKGDSVEIKCQAAGERPLTINWSKDRVVMDPRKEPVRYQLLENDKLDKLEQILFINSADRTDSALYTCTAINAYGKDEYNIQVILQEVPDKPDHIMVSGVESRSVTVSWNIPYSGNSMILSYHVEYKAIHHDWNSNDKMMESLAGSVNTIKLGNLHPITSYHLRMRCQNGIGFSGYSDVIQFTTDEEAPNLPPNDVKVYPLTSRSLQVTWKPVDLSRQFGMIKGYYLGYRKFASQDSYMFKTITSYSSSLSASSEKTDLWEVKIDDLLRSTKYGIIVQAFNGKGPGPQSEEVLGETLSNDPPPAPTLSLGETGYTHIHLQWSFEGSSYEKEDLLISGYHIHYKSYRSDWMERQVPGHLMSLRMDNLECGTSYQFYINAYNNLGKGDPSQVIAAKTLGSVPLAPSMDSFIKVNSTAAHLMLTSWKTMGCPISHLEIQYKPKTQLEWILFSNSISPDESSITLIDLKPAIWYTLSATAHSQAGSSQREYIFATLTTDGGTIAPLDRSKPQKVYSTLSLMVPTVCAVIVMIVIVMLTYLLIHRRRPPAFGVDQSFQEGSLTGESVMMCRDERLVNSENCMLNRFTDSNGKDHSMVNEFCETPSKLYFPTPYATNQVKYDSISGPISSNLTAAKIPGNTETLAKHSGHQHHLTDLQNTNESCIIPFDHRHHPNCHEHIPLYERYQVT